MEHTIGMRIPLFLAFLILTLVPLLVQVRFTSGYFYQSHVEERMAEAQNRSLILANKIRSSDYINVLLSGNPNPALDAELSTTADLMNGRIVLVDDSFKILKDTFDLSRGKTLVVSDVLKAFDGETSSYLNQKKKYFYVAQPIQAKSTDAASIDSDVAAGKGKNTAGVQGVLLLMASTENSALLQEKIVQKTGFLQLVMFCFILIADLLAAACLLKPFRRLQQQLDMVAEGNLDQDIDVKTYRETRDISEAVMQTIRKLKNLDQSRQEFVSNVSHELKTPLTSIRVLADSLMGMENTPAELYQEFMQDISAEIDREGKIIDDLLTFLPVILAVGVQVGNQRQNVGDIDDVAVEQLQTEIHVVDIFVFDLGLCSVGSALLLVSRMTDGDVEVFGTEIHVFLLGHDEIGIVRFVLLVDLRLDFSPDNLAESQHEFAFLRFAFQRVDAADVGIFLQKRDHFQIQLLAHLLERRAYDLLIGRVVTEKFDRSIHIGFKVAEAYDFSETLFLVQHAVRAAERL